MVLKTRELTGTQNLAPRGYETAHRAVVRRVGAEGMVVLKNEEKILPLDVKAPIALYGNGAIQTFYGGSGGGQVNVRESVSVYEGMRNAGFQITTEAMLLQYKQTYNAAKVAYRNECLKKLDALSEDTPLRMRIFQVYTSTHVKAPAEPSPQKTEADVAIYVLSRQAGEGRDRNNCPGDYELTEKEKEYIGDLCDLYRHVVLVINTGGAVDLSILDQHSNIHSLVFMSQPGMEAGNSLADLLCGKVPACGKLADSWAYKYSDYPTSANFSHNNGVLEKEVYDEGIYVGYRYFDSFQIPVRFGFGFGLSYTTFSRNYLGMTLEGRSGNDPVVSIRVKVTNIGQQYAGKEIIQVYVACPQEQLEKEYRRLVGFKKTDLLMPGDSQILNIRFPLYTLVSFDETLPGWILEKGTYGVFVGNCLESSAVVDAIVVKQNLIWTQTEHVCMPQEQINLREGPDLAARRITWEVEWKNKPGITVSSGDIPCTKVDYTTDVGIPTSAAQQFVANLTEDQLIHLVVGAITGASAETIGNAGIFVPGAGGQTSNYLQDKGLASIVMSDGPAGLRVMRQYRTVNEKVLPIDFSQTFAGGLFHREMEDTTAETWYQFCTAIPSETTLAQSWDTKAVEECGHLVAEEMQLFGISIWLAPGMNIHRDPLCGRNYEYYSEDPVLSAAMAVATIKGVNAIPGCFATLKHLACNNAEDNRNRSDSIITERVLREIYLKGFELALRYERPAALMTSYNKINGIHTANLYDLCTKVIRQEWGFDGLIMSDWTITQAGPACTASGCMRAGNDLIMPGSEIDIRNLREELMAGTLTRAAVERCGARVVDLVLKSGWCSL